MTCETVFPNDSNDAQGTILQFIQNRFNKATIDLMYNLTHHLMIHLGHLGFPDMISL